MKKRGMADEFVIGVARVLILAGIAMMAFAITIHLTTKTKTKTPTKTKCNCNCHKETK